MRVIKKSHDKRIKSAFKLHQSSRYYELNDCYKNPSQNKYNSYQEVKQIMREFDGFDLRIISFNSHVYTAGFFGYIDNIIYFFHITPETIRYMEIN